MTRPARIGALVGMALLAVTLAPCMGAAKQPAPAEDQPGPAADQPGAADQLPPPPGPAPAGDLPGTEPAATDPAEDSYAALEKRTVEAVQHLSARAIDSTLTDTRFDRWFRQAVGANAWVSWEMNDCGEQTGSPADSARDFPTCVQAMAEWDDGRKALVWIAVGTVKRGVFAPPELIWASAGRADTMASYHSLTQFAHYAQGPGANPQEARKK